MTLDVRSTALGEWYKGPGSTGAYQVGTVARATRPTTLSFPRGTRRTMSRHLGPRVGHKGHLSDSLTPRRVPCLDIAETRHHRLMSL